MLKTGSNKNHHMHHYQKLCQLNGTGKKQCDPYVWTEKDCHYERVFWNTESKIENNNILKGRFCLLPEPTWKFYASRKTVMDNMVI